MAGREKKKVTLTDIAGELGISPAAVSYALHDRPGVSEEMARRIRERAAQMGYELPAGQNGQWVAGEPLVLIALDPVFHRAHRELSSALRQGAVQSLRSAGARVLAAKPEHFSENPVLLVVIGSLSPQLERKLPEGSERVPRIFLGSWGDEEEPMLCEDVFHDWARMTELILERGLTPCFVRDALAAPDAIALDRRLGYCRTMQKQGLEEQVLELSERMRAQEGCAYLFDTEETRVRSGLPQILACDPPLRRICGAAAEALARAVRGERPAPGVQAFAGRIRAAEQ